MPAMQFCGGGCIASPCIVALPNTACSRRRFAAGYRGEMGLCDALRIEAHFGRVAARLTRRTLACQPQCKEGVSYA